MRRGTEKAVELSRVVLRRHLCRGVALVARFIQDRKVYKRQTISTGEGRTHRHHRVDEVISDGAPLHRVNKFVVVLG